MAKYTIDENFFKIIDTEQKAYILGFFYADGNVSKNRYQATISLSEVDKEILEKFRKELNYTGPLLFCNREKYKGQKNQWKLNISNKKICTDLISQNCIPCKSKIIQFPTEEQVPNHLYKHLIRGIFDGDGWSYNNKKNGDTKAGIVSASPNFLRQIKNITDNLDIKSSICNHKNYDVLTYSGNNNSYKFLHWLYDDALIFLKRKKEKFLLSEELVNNTVKRHIARRGVVQLDKKLNIINEFETALHAERELNIRYQNIRVCCDLNKKTAGGYYWRWK